MNPFSFEKILKHLDRVVEWQTTGLSRPVTYELDMTNICNSECVFCFGFSNRRADRSFLTIDDAKRIIAQIRQFGGRGLTFTGGGEPLCNPATVAAVRYAKLLGLDIGFITNGILLSDDVIDVLVDCCTWIRISLNAGTPQTYSAVHRLSEATFNAVLRNTALLAAKKRAKQYPVTIGTGFITSRDVKNDMAGFVELSKSMQVDYAQFRPLLRKFNEEEINGTPDHEIVGIINDCQKYTTGTFHVLSSVHKYECMKNGTVIRNYTRCQGHNFAAVIAANKKMYLCCHMRGLEKYCLGDLSNTSLEEIWRSKRRREVYENIDFDDCPLLCRCDGFNTILWNLSQKVEHENFL